ncbi:MAG: UDP-glucose 4-epimerase GalE [Candidatus Nanopelagicales bacterium]
MTRWVVTGGAGYIGAHVVRSMIESGREAVVLDDLSTGFAEFVPPGVEFVQGSLLDRASVRNALAEAVGVVHLAGWKYAGVSVDQPLDFYRENVEGTRVLLEEAVTAGIPSFVFSSSASVYGTPDVDLVDEGTPVGPESPYGETKLAGEWLLRDVCRITRLRGVSLRYFNVVGSGSADLYDASPHNLFPLVLAALKDGRPPNVHGDDYPTPDGSCVRDYIHVVDVADAHVAAVAALEAGRPVGAVYNLGRGEGVSVLEILDAFRRALGEDFPHTVGPRRPGDPARIVTSAALAGADLGWSAKYDLDDMVTSAIAAAPH